MEQIKESEELSGGEEKKHHIKTGEKSSRRAKNAHPHTGKSLLKKKSLKLHKRVHTEEKPHTRDQCGKSFAKK